MEIPTNKQIEQDFDEVKHSNHSFATSTPAHKQLKQELTGTVLQAESLCSPTTTEKHIDLLNKLLANPDRNLGYKNDTFDSTLTLEKPLSPIRAKHEKLHLSPLKYEMHPALADFNTEDEMGSLKEFKFDTNPAPLSCCVQDETFDEALKTYALDNNLSLGMSFQEWVAKGLENAETQKTLIERLVINRHILLHRFQYLNDTINEYARSLETARGDFDSKVKRIHALTNEFLNDIT